MRRKKKNVTLDDLALMVAGGFNEIKSETGEIKLEIGELKDGQEQIKLRLDNVAQRFELVESQRPVEHLEKKAGLYYR